MFRKTGDTTWTSFKTVSTINQCDTVLTFNPQIRNPAFTEMLPTQRDYENLHEHRHVKGSDSEWYAVTQSLSETCGSKVLHLSSLHFILTQGQRENICNFCHKNTTSLQFKASKKASISQKSITVLYLQYRRAQLMDEDCLATPTLQHLRS